MQLPSKIKFADESLKQSLVRLAAGTHEEKELCLNLNDAFKAISKNAFSGIQITKRLIPKEYLSNYAIDNLWKYNLPNGWRVVYSITHENVLIVSLILEWFRHKDYERKFKY